MKNSIKLLAVLFFGTIVLNAKGGISVKIFPKYSSVDTSITDFYYVNLSPYTGMPVDSFLTKLPSNFTEMKIYPGDNFFYANYLFLKYPGNITVSIYVRTFQFMNPYSRSGNWDITLFRKEAIHKIEIYDRHICENGCQ